MGGAELFLSHSSADADIARELRALLEEAGYTCWMAPDDVTGTDPWAEQILGAIDSSRAMLVLISGNANRSAHVSREVNLALGRRRAVLPVRIENVAPEASLEYLLSLVQRVDAFPLPISGHRDRILRRLWAIVPIEATTELPGMARAAPEPVTVVEMGPVPAESLATPSAAAAADTPTASAPAPASAPLGPGSRIGAFTIDALLGEGGMGTVYRATQDEPRRSVALKVIRADRSADSTYRRRFLIEKDTLAALEHPSIVPIYAAGEADGRLFIAMRLVEGEDLAAKLAAGRMSLDDVITTLRPIADAIDYAHEMAVVHRDLKPSNVILDRRGRAYLTDFGLGKHLDAANEESTPGIALGTLQYMAPEQFAGPLDPELAPRVDVYALGCVVYACLTGAPPYRAPDAERIIYGHLHGPIPNVMASRPEVSPAAAAAIGRALAKNPAYRFESADSFLDALAAGANEKAPVVQERAAASVVPAVAMGGPAVSAPAAAAPVPSPIHAPAAPVVPPPVGAATVVPSPLPIEPPPRRSGPLRRRHSLLAASVGTIATIIAVGGGVILATATPGETARASGTQAGAASVLVSQEPTSPGSTHPGDLLSFGPIATEEPILTFSPTSSPEPTEAPGPTDDVTPPTGARIVISKNVVFLPKVNLSLGASSASQLRLGAATSASGKCSWNTWRSYTQSIKDWKISGGVAGRRWVCAQYQDAAGNRSSVVRDSVIFDNKPVAKSFTYDYGTGTTYHDATCATIKSSGGISLTLIPYIATDPDGNSTFDVVSVTQGSKAYTISPDGRSVYIYFTVTSNFSAFTGTFAFKVEDEHGGTDTGSFVLKVGPCP